MVITCSQCGTRFYLDETRITGERAKARCSSCRHLFWVSRQGEVAEIITETWQMPEESPPEVEAQAPSPPLPPQEREDLPSPSTAPQGPILANGTAPATKAAGPSSRSWKFLLGIILTAMTSIALGVGLAKYFDLGWRLKHYVRGFNQPSETLAVKPPAAPPAPQDLQELRVEGAEAFFQGLINDQGGRMLVIGGEVKNTGKQSRGPVLLKAALTDPQNRPVMERRFYAGTRMTAEELKKLPPGDINRWLDTPGGRSRMLMVRPGEGQPFTVVFFETPEKLAEGLYGYTVTIIEGPAAAPTP